MKRKTLIRILAALLVLGILGFIGVMYLPRTDFYKNLTTPKGGSVTATDIVKAYTENESHADSTYNGKAIEVSGMVKESKIENGKTTVMLQSADSTAGVYFVLKDSLAPLATGSQTTIKGICTGFLGDVQFNEGTIIKK